MTLREQEHPPWPIRKAPPGYRAEWVIDTEWRPSPDGNACRFVSGHPLRKCGRPAVALFERGLNGWYPYCDRHLYGRRFWDGNVWTERLVLIGESAS